MSQLSATAGYRGIATASHGGTATAGEWGTATVGDGGTATAGIHGTVSAGENGTISLWYSPGLRYYLVTGQIGKEGLKPNTPYRLDPYGEFYEVVDKTTKPKVVVDRLPLRIRLAARLASLRSHIW